MALDNPPPLAKGVNLHSLDALNHGALVVRSIIDLLGLRGGDMHIGPEPLSAGLILLSDHLLTLRHVERSAANPT